MLKICCASLPIKPVVNEDLADLKGKWDGIRSSTGKYSLGALQGLSTLLEIKNDSLPLTASLFFLETKEGIIEYPILLDIMEGKLVSTKYNVILTLCRKENRLRLKGQMDVGKYYEEFVFWKDTRTCSFHPFPVSQPSKNLPQGAKTKALRA